MGPRSVERGKDVCVYGAFEQCEASMGPRSVERGKATEPPDTMLMTASFNGAAFC